MTWPKLLKSPPRRNIQLLVRHPSRLLLKFRVETNWFLRKAQKSFFIKITSSSRSSVSPDSRRRIWNQFKTSIVLVGLSNVGLYEFPFRCEMNFFSAILEARDGVRNVLSVRYRDGIRKLKTFSILSLLGSFSNKWKLVIFIDSAKWNEMHTNIAIVKLSLFPRNELSPQRYVVFVHLDGWKFWCWFEFFEFLAYSWNVMAFIFLTRPNRKKWWGKKVIP